MDVIRLSSGERKRRGHRQLAFLDCLDSGPGQLWVCVLSVFQSSTLLISQQPMRNLIKPVWWLSSQLDGGCEFGWLWWFWVGCRLFVHWIFKGLFFSFLVLITGFCCQWQCKGSLSRVSDLTQLTKIHANNYSVGWLSEAVAELWFIFSPLQRRESICDGEAETDCHEWQIGTGHLTPRWRTFAAVMPLGGSCDMSPPWHTDNHPNLTSHQPACSSLSVTLLYQRDLVFLTTSVFNAQACVSH